MTNFTINEKGYWESEDSSGHVHDRNLCISIAAFLKNQKVKKVLDLGCGMGDYARFFINNEIECDAYDGNPNTPNLTQGIGKVLDFTEEFNLAETYECVLSLEVGEHIPNQYEQIFIDNLCRHSKKYILLSWAVIGQGGDGHVNCQNNDYVINEMIKRNFTFLSKETNHFRNSVTNATWFINTIMLFERQ